jgi:hypothetical protein
MHRFSKPLALTGIISIASVGAVHAQVTATVGGGAQSGANYVNFDSLSTGSTSSYSSGALTVLFGGNASTVQGSQYGATMPVLSGNNNVDFESPATLPALGESDATTYLQAGNTGSGGEITFNFSGPELYFGAVVGSVDANNSFAFYSGANGTGTLLETVLGSDLLSSSGDTQFGGTVYMNVDTTSNFESVVATTGTTTLEIDNVAYGVASSSVPDSATTISLLGGAFVCLHAARRRFSR